jgi:hypothetical protein
MEHLMGWAGVEHPHLIEEAFNILPDECKEFVIKGEMGSRPVRVMLWEVARKVLGGDIPQFPQEIGDCVSFGSSHACEFSLIFDIANGLLSDFKKLFPPYIYGISRVQIGGSRIWGDGSVGAWAAKGVQDYGVVPLDGPGVPQYSGSVAKSWGRSGPPQNIIQLGKQKLIKKVANIRTWDQSKDALANGWCLILCSNIGYDMKARSDGFMYNSTSWGHCLALIGYDEGDGNIKEHGCILNNWYLGAHGIIKDFRTGEQWPDNTIRAHPNDIEKALSQGDCFVMSGLEGFNVRTIDESFFNVL